MTQAQLVLRILALLFLYPSKEWFDQLALIKEATQEIGDPQLENLLSDFVAYVEEMGLHDYEEQYIRVFDFSKNTNLYLSTHNCTDSGKQAAELVEFSAFFAQNGYTIDKEMPDYLPALLELTSTVEKQEMYRILQYAMPKLQILRERFIEAKLPYAFLLDVLFTLSNRLEVA